MARNNQQSLRQRKLELEAELSAIEGELNDSVDKVKDDVRSTLDPVEYIKKYPLPVVASSILVGFLAGKGGGGSDEPVEQENEVLSTLWYELKRAAVRKGVRIASEQAEELVNGLFED